MPDAIDDLESLLVGALQARDTECVVCVRQVITRWREQWGGDEVYIARRAHMRKHTQIMDMIAQGLSTAQIAERLGASPRQVQRVKQKASSYL